jgi:hypothetical protein
VRASIVAVGIEFLRVRRIGAPANAPTDPVGIASGKFSPAAAIATIGDENSFTIWAAVAYLSLPAMRATPEGEQLSRCAAIPSDMTAVPPMMVMSAGSAVPDAYGLATIPISTTRIAMTNPTVLSS